MPKKSILIFSGFGIVFAILFIMFLGTYTVFFGLGNFKYLSVGMLVLNILYLVFIFFIAKVISSSRHTNFKISFLLLILPLVILYFVSFIASYYYKNVIRPKESEKSYEITPFYENKF